MIIRNALKSISRAKGRNVLIGIIVLTVAVSACVALAIRSAADAARESGLKSQTITGTISVDRTNMLSSVQGMGGQSDAPGEMPDRDSMREIMGQNAELSIDELLEYAQSDYIKDFYYTATVSLSASGGIEAYGSSSSSSSADTDAGNSSGTDFPGGMGGGGMGGFMAVAMGDFSVSAYSSESAMTKFINGESKLTDGEMFDFSSSELNCLISYELAVFNSLEAGDTIELTNPNNEEETYIFTIVGIFTNTSSSASDGQMMFSTSQDPANLICISYSAMEGLVSLSEETSAETEITALAAQTSGTYVFADVASYEGFETELAAKGLSENYVLTSTDITAYEESLVPIENLASFATTLLWVILGVGAVILIVLNIFNIRERKYEVGVLTAIGIKKGKVATQFVLELLIVTMVAFVIGASIGAVVSVPVSNSLLESQVASQETAQTAQEENFGRPGGQQMGGQMPNIRENFILGGAQSPVEYLDTLNAAVSFGVLGQLLGIGVILTIISSLAGIVFVLRYEPLKILANR